MEEEGKTVERWLFAAHKGYCAHERNWWTRWQHGDNTTTCICDEPRAALDSLLQRIKDLEHLLMQDSVPMRFLSTDTELRERLRQTEEELRVARWSCTCGSWLGGACTCPDRPTALSPRQEETPP